MLAAIKCAAVRQQKDEVIRQEIAMIGERDSEVRKLERYEQQLLKRLQMTHLKQQEAIEQIQDMVMLSQAGSRTGATKGLASPPTAQSDGGDGDGCCESMQLRLDASISTQGR